MNILNKGNQLRFLYFLYYAAGTSWVPIFSNYLNQNKMSGFEIGMLLTISPVVMLLVQPFWGVLADKLGRKWLLFLATVLTAFIFFFFRCPLTYWQLFLLTLGLSVFWSTLSPLVDVIALDYVEENNGSYSEFRMWGAVGWSTASWIMSFVLVNNEYVIYLRIAAFILIGCSFLLLFITPPKPLSKIEGVNISPEGFRNTFGNKWLLIFFVFVFVHGVTTTSIWNYEGLLLEKLGASQKLLRSVFGLQGLFEIPFFFLADRIIRRFGIGTTLIVSFIATVVRLLLYGIISNPASILYVDLTHGLSWSLFWVCCVEFANRNIAPEWRATGQSLLWAIYLGAGCIVGNILFGVWLDRLNIQTIFLIDFAILLLFTILLIPFAVKTQKSHVKQLPAS